MQCYRATRLLLQWFLNIYLWYTGHLIITSSRYEKAGKDSRASTRGSLDHIIFFHFHSMFKPQCVVAKAP